MRAVHPTYCEPTSADDLEAEGKARHALRLLMFRGVCVCVCVCVCVEARALASGATGSDCQDKMSHVSGFYVKALFWCKNPILSFARWGSEQQALQDPTVHTH